VTWDAVRANTVLLLVAAVILAAAETACQGTSEQTRFRESLPAFEDIQFIRIETYPLNPETPLPLTQEANGERIHWILDQLRSSRISGLPVDQQGLFHAAPVLQMYVPSSTERLNIFPAVDCRSPHEGQYNCRYNARDVVVNRGSEFWRIVAPELAVYRWTGWEADTRMVSQDEHRAFMEQQFPWPGLPNATPARLWMVAFPSSSAVAQPLVASNPGDARVMQKVVDWLRQASSGSSDTEAGDAQRFEATMGLMIAFSDDIGLGVAPAYICISDGTNEPCYRSPDEVLVEDYRGFRGQYHLRSPELAQWLASGYLADMRMGTYEEYQREAHW
jgi:hypothetical protein